MPWDSVPQDGFLQHFCLILSGPWSVTTAQGPSTLRYCNISKAGSAPFWRLLFGFLLDKRNDKRDILNSFFLFKQ